MTTENKPLGMGEARLAGRLLKVTKKNDLFIHLMVLPAPDAYTSPSTVEILSKTRIGQAQDEITCLVRITGYRRTYNHTDRETGETRQVQTADVRLSLLEG
jgi:hypothetical protein